MLSTFLQEIHSIEQVGAIAVLAIMTILVVGHLRDVLVAWAPPWSAEECDHNDVDDEPGQHQGEHPLPVDDRMNASGGRPIPGLAKREDDSRPS